MIYEFVEMFPILSYGMLWYTSMLPTMWFYTYIVNNGHIDNEIREFGIGILSVSIFLVSLTWPITTAYILYGYLRGK